MVVGVKSGESEWRGFRVGRCVAYLRLASRLAPFSPTCRRNAATAFISARSPLQYVVLSTDCAIDLTFVQ